MSTVAQKRLIRDLKRLQKDPPDGINAAPSGSDIMHWRAVILGPNETPWEGGVFKLLLEFTEDYPNVPPVVQFESKIFHPNVYTNGKICIDILKSQWSVIYDVTSILLCCQSLLSDPNPASAANPEASAMFENDRREFFRRVRLAVEESWRGEIDEEGGSDADAEADSGADLKTGGGASSAESGTNLACGTSSNSVEGLSMAAEELSVANNVSSLSRSRKMALEFEEIAQRAAMNSGSTSQNLELKALPHKPTDGEDALHSP